MSVLMTCARHYTLRTKAGHCLRFKPNEPVAVPDSVVSEALALNIIPVDGSDVRTADDAAPLQKVVIAGLLRDALALHCIDDLVKMNDVEQFDGGGRPKVAVINQATGLSLSAADRNDYWDKYRTIKSEGEELPKHKALATVLEIQALNTPSHLKEYAEALGVNEDAILGHPIAVQKQVLLKAAVAGA